MAYTVCRIQKIKDWGTLVSSELHTTRERDTPNADPAVHNIRLIGSKSDPDLATIFKAKIGNQKIRSNAVLGVEFVLSASAEYFRPDDSSIAGTYNQKRLDDFAEATIKWLKQSWGDRVVRCELHLDEATPHIHAYLVPLDERGKLNCRALFGGTRKRLSELQDSFAAAVAPLGIERGIKGSTAKHTKVKEYYASINRQSLNLDLEQTLPIATQTENAIAYRERVKETLQPSLDIINHQLSDRAAALKRYHDMEQKARASEKQRQKLEQRILELEAEVFKYKEELLVLRDLPLEDVAYNLGLDPDYNNKHKWKGYGHIISITDSKFYDFSGEQRGGGGAIDLVMHVKECNFQQAVAWLGDRFGESGMIGAVTNHTLNQAQQIALVEPVAKFTPPEPDEKGWQAVQHYLTTGSKLPENLVQTLHKRGLVYADSKQNAVFIMRSLDGDVTGAFLRGTMGKDNTFIGLEKGSKRNAGWFYVRSGGKSDDPIQRAVLTKSPIDALSASVLEQPQQLLTLYLAIDSARSLPVEFLSKIPTVVAAYDNNTAGNEMARLIKQLLPQGTQTQTKSQGLERGTGQA
ncbi:MobV family relaxase [Tolypothrix sp. VBCCA 56010]|uniref:MobV family relaxase n=1 Tax=Tolypothrix sp. VBCCA 56010 TaxID=3137731 RepID=UPI003D7CB3F1